MVSPSAALAMFFARLASHLSIVLSLGTQPRSSPSPRWAPDVLSQNTSPLLAWSSWLSTLTMILAAFRQGGHSAATFVATALNLPIPFVVSHPSSSKGCCASCAPAPLAWQTRIAAPALAAAFETLASHLRTL